MLTWLWMAVSLQCVHATTFFFFYCLCLFLLGTFQDLKVPKQSIAGRCIAYDPLNAYNNSWERTTNKSKTEGGIQIISLRKHINPYEVLSQLRQNVILSKKKKNCQMMPDRELSIKTQVLWSCDLWSSLWGLGAWVSLQAWQARY